MRPGSAERPRPTAECNGRCRVIGLWRCRERPAMREGDAHGATPARPAWIGEATTSVPVNHVRGWRAVTFLMWTRMVRQRGRPAACLYGRLSIPGKCRIDERRPAVDAVSTLACRAPTSASHCDGPGERGNGGTGISVSRLRTVVAAVGVGTPATGLVGMSPVCAVAGATAVAATAGRQASSRIRRASLGAGQPAELAGRDVRLPNVDRAATGEDAVLLQTRVTP